jgi:dipeptidyl aminopeptidase/acylaminoacyl peptidase
MRVKTAFAAVAGVVFALVLAPTSEGSFPGHNGKFAFERSAQPPTSPCCVTHVFVANPDGTGLIDITPASNVFVSQPAWSADGLKLAVNGMTTMNADGSNRLPSGAGGTPAWSPDGTRLTASRNGDLLPSGSHNPDIFVMNVDGTNQINLINDPPGDGPFDTEPDWSPDGTRIAFHSNRTFPPDGFQRGILSIAPNGQGLQRLTAGSADLSPDWSPDGTKIVFQRSPVLFDDSEIYVMNADGTGVQRLTDNSVYEENPVWSPDGRKIVFGRESPVGHFSLWTMNSDGSGEGLAIAEARFADWQALPNHPPDCTNVTAGSSELVPPNNKLVPVTISGAADPDGDVVAFSATSVTQDEPTGTTPDAVTGPGPSQVSLRAERDGAGDGRVYRIVVRGDDGFGGTCTGTVRVGVPKGTRPATDSSPPSYDSFGS